MAKNATVKKKNSGKDAGKTEVESGKTDGDTKSGSECKADPSGRRGARNGVAKAQAAGNRPKATGKRRGGRNKAALIKKVIEKIEAKIESDELKATVGDFIRLMQLEKEIEDDQPKEIKVTWVEPAEKRSSET